MQVIGSWSQPSGDDGVSYGCWRPSSSPNSHLKLLIKTAKICSKWCFVAMKIYRGNVTCFRIQNNFRIFSFKAWPNARNISTQHLATLLGTTCCVRLATLLRYVAMCCNMLDYVGSNLKTVKFFVQHFGCCMMLYSFGHVYATLLR